MDTQKEKYFKVTDVSTNISECNSTST